MADWKEVDHATEQGARYTITSFGHWAEDPTFLNWLIEDEWQPEKSKEAQAILAAKVEEYINDEPSASDSVLHGMSLGVQDLDHLLLLFGTKDLSQ